jgi:hypothetical protein
MVPCLPILLLESLTKNADSLKLLAGFDSSKNSFFDRLHLQRRSFFHDDVISSVQLPFFFF